MYFKCDISKITTEQLAVISAVQSLFHEQSQKATVTSIKPITFEVFGNLTDAQKQRLLVNRLPTVMFGYVGELEGHSLVVQKKAEDKPIKRRRKARASSDSDILTSEGEEVAQQAVA